jgi:phosphoribosylformylglycinamidine synthase
VIAATAAIERLLELAREHGVPARRIGCTGGDRLRIGPEAGEIWIDAALERLHHVWTNALPRRIGAARER